MRNIFTACGLACAILAATVMVTTTAEAKGRTLYISYKVHKGPFKKPADHDGYRYTCNSFLKCGNWNVAGR